MARIRVVMRRLVPIDAHAAHGIADASLWNRSSGMINVLVRVGGHVRMPGIESNTP
jgi:hypothetical protein